MRLMNDHVPVRSDGTGMSSFGLVLQTMLCVAWQLFSLIWVWFQRMLWLFSGVSSQRRMSRARAGYYLGAHVQDILYRFKYDEFLGAGSASNFLVVHREFVSMDYLRKDNVFLYDLTREGAVFVEGEEGTQLWRLEFGSFFGVSLFRNSRRVVTVPLGHFHRFAEELGDPKGKLIFLANGSRCGSTLLCRAFESTDRAVVYSEPHALEAVSFLQSSFPPDVIDVLARDVIRVMCKPVKSPGKVDAYVFKQRSPQTTCATLYGRLFPNAKQIFMWRDRKKTAESSERLLNQMPSYMIARSTYWIPSWIRAQFSYHILGRHCGFFPQDFTDICSHPILAGLLPVAVMLGTYKRLYAAEYKIAAVRYEDIFADQKYCFKAIFDYCNLGPEVLTKAMSACGEDSQKYSGFAKATVENATNSPWTSVAKVKANEIMKRHGLPPMDVPVAVEGVISCRPKGIAFST